MIVGLVTDIVDIGCRRLTIVKAGDGDIDAELDENIVRVFKEVEREYFKFQEILENAYERAELSEN